MPEVKEQEPTDREKMAALLAALRDQGVVWVSGLEILEQIEDLTDDLFREIDGYRDDIRQGRHTVR